MMPNDIPGRPNRYIRDDNGVDEILLTVVAYTDFPGVAVMPAAGNETDAPLVYRNHSAYQVKTVQWTAIRSGGPPRVPHPGTQELRGEDIYLGGQVNNAAPTLLPGGMSHTWQVSGVYSYLTKRKRFGVDDLPTPKLPNDTSSAQEMRLPASAFDPSLTGGSSFDRIR